MDKHLHIVTHDVPWPADYGGVVDLFYKIRSLHGLGVKIHLHCFTNGRMKQPLLDHYCESVHYYQRKGKLASFSLRIPYIVKSRSDESLLRNIQADDHPVLLEGTHCTYFLHNGKLSGRKVFVRLHNIEYKYYGQLARHEKNIFRKIYFGAESLALRKFEKEIAAKATFWPVSVADTTQFQQEFKAKNIDFLPVFIPWDSLKSQPGTGTFCLYHGNLAVNENSKAAEWLLNEVFNQTEIPFVIAGRNPSAALKALAHRHPHTCMVVNPSEHELQDLIRKAQVNILPSFNNTGVKLKLLNALYNGRHCLVNKETTDGSGLYDLCQVAEGAHEFRKEILRLFHEPFTEKNIQLRDAALSNIYDNGKNARQLISWIY